MHDLLPRCQGLDIGAMSRDRLRLEGRYVLSVLNHPMLPTGIVSAVRPRKRTLSDSW